MHNIICLPGQERKKKPSIFNHVLIIINIITGIEYNCFFFKLNFLSQIKANEMRVPWESCLPKEIKVNGGVLGLDEGPEAPEEM